MKRRLDCALCGVRITDANRYNSQICKECWRAKGRQWTRNWRAKQAGVEPRTGAPIAPRTQCPCGSQGIVYYHGKTTGLCQRCLTAYRADASRKARERRKAAHAPQP